MAWTRAGASTTRVLVLYKMINMNILKTLYSSTTRVLIFQYSYSYVQYSPQPWLELTAIEIPCTRLTFLTRIIWGGGGGVFVTGCPCRVLCCRLINWPLYGGPLFSKSIIIITQILYFSISHRHSPNYFLNRSILGPQMPRHHKSGMSPSAKWYLY